MSDPAHILPVEIEIAKIELRKPIQESWFSEDTAKKIAESIKVDGLLHPITVRPHPTKPGEYLQVTGLHRLYACAKILGWTHIQADVRSNYTDETAYAWEILPILPNRSGMTLTQVQ
jgi:ParB/RepB/Spo0J family partition protein